MISNYTKFLPRNNSESSYFLWESQSPPRKNWAPPLFISGSPTRQIENYQPPRPLPLYQQYPLKSFNPLFSPTKTNFPSTYSHSLHTLTNSIARMHIPLETSCLTANNCHAKFSIVICYSWSSLFSIWRNASLLLQNLGPHQTTKWGTPLLPWS